MKSADGELVINCKVDADDGKADMDVVDKNNDERSVTINIANMSKNMMKGQGISSSKDILK